MKHKIILIFILVPVILCSLFGPNIFYYLTEKQDYTISVSMDENETHILAVETESKLESFSHQYRDGNGFLIEEIHFIGDEKKILEMVIQSNWISVLQKLLGENLPSSFWDSEGQSKDFTIQSSCILVRSSQTTPIQDGLIINRMLVSFSLEDYFLQMRILVDAETNMIYGMELQYYPYIGKDSTVPFSEKDFSDSLTDFYQTDSSLFSYQAYYETDFNFFSESGRENIRADYQEIGSKRIFDFLSQSINCMKLVYDDDYLCLDYFYEDISALFGFEKNAFSIVLCIDELLDILHWNEDIDYLNLQDIQVDYKNDAQMIQP